MTPPTLSPARITTETFLADPHAARYADVVLRDHSNAFAAVLAILNDPAQQAQLQAAERYGRPALTGIVSEVESEVSLAGSLSSPRFRQAVGVAVRLTMEALGWSKTGHKGPVRGAAYFTSAERYEPPPSERSTAMRADRARAALEAVAQIGDEDERSQTGEELLDALERTRRADNRPF